MCLSLTKLLQFKFLLISLKLFVWKKSRKKFKNYLKKIIVIFRKIHLQLLGSLQKSNHKDNANISWWFTLWSIENQIKWIANYYPELQGDIDSIVLFSDLIWIIVLLSFKMSASEECERVCVQILKHVHNNVKF